MLDYLDLDESKIALLKVSRSLAFEPEPQNCFFNVWVQCLYSGGTAQHGWIIGQGRANQFTEAQFHAIWVSPTGETLDVTPRLDDEKRLMFVPDGEREIRLIEHEGQPAITSFDTVRFWKGRLNTPLTPIIVVPQTEMIRKYGLYQNSDDQ